VTRITEAFARPEIDGGATFVPYITCGDPNLERTPELVRALDAAGAGVIELGVPFSDPLADGPTIQAASERALASGTTLAGIIRMIEGLRDEVRAALLVFTYWNPVFRYGPANFCRDAAAAGADGVLVADLPPEEAAPLVRPARRAKLETVFLVAPTSGAERIKKAAEISRGFLYAVSLTGVTGARGALPPDLAEFVARIKGLVELPVAVGFGISTPAQAAEVAGIADGVVVGSALVKVIGEFGDSPELVARVGELAGELAGACRGKA